MDTIGMSAIHVSLSYNKFYNKIKNKTEKLKKEDAYGN